MSDFPNLGRRGAHVVAVPNRVVAGDESATGGARLHAETICPGPMPTDPTIACKPCGIRFRGHWYIEIDIDFYILYQRLLIDFSNKHTPIFDSIPDRSISIQFHTFFRHVSHSRSRVESITIRTRVGSDTIVASIDIIERRKPIGYPKVKHILATRAICL